MGDAREGYKVEVREKKKETTMTAEREGKRGGWVAL